MSASSYSLEDIEDWTAVEDLPDAVGETVTVKGWLYNSRSSGSIAFLEVRDGTGLVQAVVGEDEVDAEEAEPTSDEASGPREQRSKRRGWWSIGR